MNSCENSRLESIRNSTSEVEEVPTEIPKVPRRKKSKLRHSREESGKLLQFYQSVGQGAGTSGTVEL